MSSENPNWEWDDGDFHTLLSNPHCSTEYLAALLPRQSPTTIAIVRQGVCDYHKKRANILLSEMMVHELDTKKGRRACYVCGEMF